MRNEDKEKIRDMRIKGLGYVTVVIKMGLNLNTVKSYCRGHGLGSNDIARTKIRVPFTKTPSCRNCGLEIKQEPKRKRKLFCCDRCRNQWWNRHLDQVNRKSYYKIFCRHCGKVFTVYGNKQRKYCSHACYIAERFSTYPK
ncbi:MAG: RNA polymerase subunit sigma-70 [Veillonella magna]|nr:RNA polymerase subunit sigma-70 [Veillonella magna]